MEIIYKLHIRFFGITYSPCIQHFDELLYAVCPFKFITNNVAEASEMKPSTMTTILLFSFLILLSHSSVASLTKGFKNSLGLIVKIWARNFSVMN